MIANDRMLAKTVKEIIPGPHPETLTASSSSLLKNFVFQQAAYGTGMYRHFRWLQAIENGSNLKTTFFELRC
jgi:hypothetical protein